MVTGNEFLSQHEQNPQNITSPLPYINNARSIMDKIICYEGEGELRMKINQERMITSDCSMMHCISRCKFQNLWWGENEQNPSYYQGCQAAAVSFYHHSKYLFCKNMTLSSVLTCAVGLVKPAFPFLIGQFNLLIKSLNCMRGLLRSAALWSYVLNFRINWMIQHGRSYQITKLQQWPFCRLFQLLPVM